jgi:hypothetical protein
LLGITWPDQQQNTRIINNLYCGIQDFETGFDNNNMPGKTPTVKMEAAGSYTASHPRTPREHHVSHRDYAGYNSYEKGK